MNFCILPNDVDLNISDDQIVLCVCLDGSCVQADGTSWSMILNGTNNSALSQSDVTDSVSSLSPNSAASSLPVTHGTVTPAGSPVDRFRTTLLQSTTSNVALALSSTLLSCTFPRLNLESNHTHTDFTAIFQVIPS